MIQVETKNAINKTVTIFISSDEPLYKYAAFFIKMLQKNYVTGLDGKPDVNSAFNSTYNCYGNRIKFYESRNNAISEYSYLTIQTTKRNEQNQLEESLKLKLRNQRNNFDIQYLIDFTNSSNNTSINMLNIFSKNMPINQISFPKIESTLNFNSAAIYQNNEEYNPYADKIINELIFFESHYDKTKLLGTLSSFCESTSDTIKINLRQFTKLSKFIPFIEQIKYPSNKSRNRLIENCSIFKMNKVLETLKNGILTFTKMGAGSNTSLKVKLLNFTLFHEQNFNRFKYLDHPGINFLADFLDKTNQFDILEARISKEILTRI